MSTSILVHGAWHGSWCWDKVVPLLEQADHQVQALDLPGHGQDKTPLREVTLATYTNCVCEALDAQTEPVILVGHSPGGLAITQAAGEGLTRFVGWCTSRLFSDRMARLPSSTPNRHHRSWSDISVPWRL